MTSIRFKIVVLVLSLALSEAAILGVIGYSSVSAEARASKQLEQVAISAEKKNDFVLALTRAAGQARLFAWDRDDAALGRFDEEWAEVERRMRPCGSTSCHGLAEQPARMLREIRPSAHRIREEWARILSGELSEERVLGSVQVIESETDHIVGRTEDMTQKVQERIRKLAKARENALQSALVLIALTTLGTVLVAMLFSYLLVDSITRPLYDVVEGVRRFASGQLSHRVPSVGGKETALLGRAFNDMADSLAKHQEWLQDEIRRRDATLSASERLATIGLIASSVGHELNNPLTSVQMNAGLALEQVPEDAPVRRFLERIAADTERCRSIASNIRMMASRRIGELAPCELDVLLNEAVRIMRPRAEARRVALELVSSGESDLDCLCDRQRTMQVVLNLLENALDASPEEAVIELRARKTDAGPAIQVADRGTGIAPDKRELVFEQFFTTKDSGLGLGLAIAQHLVREQGGTIEFETATEEEERAGGRPKGTTFTVVLPAARKEEAA